MAEKRYIDAEKLTFSRVRIIHSDGTIGGWHAVVMSSVIKNAPAEDVVEVRHGEWDIKSRSWRLIDDYDEEIYVECPFCKRTFYIPYELDDEKALAYARENYPYCHCGAKMDGERKDKP